MLLNGALTLSLAAISLASPVVIKSTPPADAVFIACKDGTKDPLCFNIKQPSQDVITKRIHPNGTVEVKKNLYTRAQLQAIREQNNVVSVEHQPNQEHVDGSAAFISSLTKRESAPPICTSEIQQWYDTQDWGYWWQARNQVGTCFYCDDCSEAIVEAFAVAQTWTYGMSTNFDGVVTASFGFSWGETFTLTDTRTCEWKFVENGCHSIWYQPLMSYHNGWANYQTHTHCSAGQGDPPSDSYYGHNWGFANVNQGVNNGANQGNLGCDSGCGGSDRRHCGNANNGGILWPYAN